MPCSSGQSFILPDAHRFFRNSSSYPARLRARLPKAIILRCRHLYLARRFSRRSSPVSKGWIALWSQFVLVFATANWTAIARVQGRYVEIWRVRLTAQACEGWGRVPSLCHSRQPAIPFRELGRMRIATKDVFAQFANFDGCNVGGTRLILTEPRCRSYIHTHPWTTA